MVKLCWYPATGMVDLAPICGGPALLSLEGTASLTRPAVVNCVFHLFLTCLSSEFLPWAHSGRHKPPKGNFRRLDGESIYVDKASENKKGGRCKPPLLTDPPKPEHSRGCVPATPGSQSLYCWLPSLQLPCQCRSMSISSGRPLKK